MTDHATHRSPETQRREPIDGLHVIVGAGPVGTTTALALADAGRRVRVVTRSGGGPEHPLVERVRADAADAAAIRSATAGAAVIVNAVNPPYHRWAQEWPAMHRGLMDAAAAHDAVLVMMDNLYSYGDTGGRPISRDLPQTATFTNGRVRGEMADELLAAHRAGTLRATIARAADFVGPLVLGSSMGDRVVPRVIAGKDVQVLGQVDQPHSLAYMPDVARTLVAIGSDPAAWGQVWHVPSAPAVSQRQFVDLLAAAAGTSVRTKALPGAMLRVAGVFVKPLRPLREVQYQFDRPFVVDARATTTTFGIEATPLDQVAHATVRWFTERSHKGHDRATAR